MPKLTHSLSVEYKSGFRTDAIASMFDVKPEKKLTRTWEIDIPIENMDWKIGLIYGPSGSGKTSIARKIWPDKYHTGYEWSDRSIIEDFPEDKSTKEITKALSSVGFSSPPDWLKPFHALSNGQQFRAEVARLLLDDENYPDVVVLDEFSSLVNREVAKASSAAVQRYIRASSKRFVAVSCHSDIIEWLSPDFTYEVAGGKFTDLAAGRDLRQSQHPPIELKITRVQREVWDEFGFGNHHYLNPDLKAAGHLWGCFWKDSLVAVASIKKFPHNRVLNAWNFSRVVVLPDYQGLKIGVALTDTISHHYCSLYKQRMFLNGSHPAMLAHSRNSESWMLKQGARRVGRPSKKGKMTGMSLGRMIESFEYVGHIRGPMKDKSLTYIGDTELDRKIFTKTED
jgi:ABC-type lipoprotein export system ATPase subunit